ncbi:hypothetical protein CMUS01_04957 [Colletotrichum musicola]|uniref:Uncharacterized protein n=1 Tax=Colletotrichum musicola TaxID=2175873 RepID=A0A8H6KU46_9PEZI|nr:hypothetical protein CMUS01_04957 [Colletotrichum musicola]
MHLITQTRLTALPLGPSGRKKQCVEEERYPVACVVAPNDSHTDLPPCHCRRRRTRAVVTRSQDPDTGTESAALRSRQVASPSCDPAGLGSLSSSWLLLTGLWNYTPRATSADTPANPIAEARRYGEAAAISTYGLPSDTGTSIMTQVPGQAKSRRVPRYDAIQKLLRTALGGGKASALIDGILARDGRVARRRSREPGASTAIHITQPTDRKHDSWDPAVWGTSIGTEHRAQGRRHRWRVEASQSMGRDGCKATTAEAGFADALLAAFSPGEAASTTATERKADRV